MFEVKCVESRELIYNQRLEPLNAQGLNLSIRTIWSSAMALGCAFSTARSMAGIAMGIGIRTAQDLLAKTETRKTRSGLPAHVRLWPSGTRSQGQGPL
jgi:hypothetical protein